MGGYSNQLLNLQEAIRQQALIHKRIVERIRSQTVGFDRFAERLRQLNEFPKRIAEWDESFRRLVKELPERDRKALQRLGEEGWFVDPDMPVTLLRYLEALFREHPDEMAEALSGFLSGFYRKRLDVIEGKLIDSYPRRGHLFQQAFEAHCEGKYGLSVPVFLTQADGIFWERTPENQSLFISKQRMRASSEYASHISGRYIEIWLHPLIIPLPLWMNKSERDDRSESFVGLNRHQVLHGESTDYDTEQNSLKAISLLSYLHWILSRTDEPEDDDS